MTKEEANEIYPPLQDWGLSAAYRAGRWKARRFKLPNATIRENTSAGSDYQQGYMHGLIDCENLVRKLMKENLNADHKKSHEGVLERSETGVPVSATGKGS